MSRAVPSGVNPGAEDNAISEDKITKGDLDQIDESVRVEFGVQSSKCTYIQSQNIISGERSNKGGVSVSQAFHANDDEQS